MYHIVHTPYFHMLVRVGFKFDEAVTSSAIRGDGLNELKAPGEINHSASAGGAHWPPSLTVVVGCKGW